jgi:uncharacterized repeat protein (TIGR01451 family)
MKSLAWKLATLAAVVGIGFLVLLQAQRGMNQALSNKQGEPQGVALGTPTPADPPPAAATKSTPDLAKADDVAQAPAQLEPQAIGSPKPTPVDAKPDAGQKPLKMAELPTKLPDASGSPMTGDPFGDANDAKHPEPAAPSGGPDKSAVAPGDVKQTSATGDDNSPKPDLAPARTPTPNPPAAAPLTIPAGPPLLADPKAPVGQSEPAGSPPSAQTADQNNALKDTQPKDTAHKDTASKENAGPQLLVPGDGPTAPAGPGSDSKPDLKTTDSGPSAGLPAPGIDDAKKQPSAGGSAKANSAISESAPFPALDDPPNPSAAPAIPDKTSPKTSPSADVVPAGHPDPFPVDAAKEVPLTKTPAAKSPEPTLPEPKLPEPNPSEAKPDALPAGPKIDAQLPPAKSVDASSAAPSTGPRGGANLHAEPPPDFQGDGTVGEQAPLGPQRPQLNIEKVAPQNALLGQPLIYSILVKNVGNSEAHDVVVEDRIPKGSKLSGTIPRAELTGKKLVWRIGNLGPGEQRKISIRVIPLEAGEIGSVATVNFVAEAAAETVVTAPRLEFELSAPRDAKLGKMVPFHFKVKNVGTGEARGVVIRDLIPAGLSHSAGNDLEYELGRLPPGKWKELTLELKATKIGPTLNRAVVVGDGGLSVKAEAAIEVSGSKIALSRSGPSRRYLGRPAVYSTTLVNESKDGVEGVVAVESVPMGMDFAGATHGGQYNEGTRTIAWRIERMLPGETRVVKSKLIPKATGAQNSTVRISVPDGEPSEATSETVVEGFAALGVEVASADGPVDVGEKVTLRINARNKGSIAATNVVVTVDVPDQMAILSIRGPGKHTQEGNQVRFGPISTLEGRTAATCEVVLQANKRGDNRIRVNVRADQIDKPLTREESVLVLSESSEPAAAR